jgi:hypothetical protein
MQIRRRLDPNQTPRSTTRDQAIEQLDVSKRNFGGLLLGGTAGLVLAGCVSRDGDTVHVGETTAAIGGANFSWVNSINGGTGTPANLRAIVGSDASSASTPVIVVGGYSTVGDGGGGTFFWDASSATGDNDGTIIVPTGGTGRWVRLYSGPINVRWFGATGLNVVDDAAKINAAITYAGSTGGGTVLVPRGMYRLDTPLQMFSAGVRLVGEGIGATFLEKNSTDSQTIIFNANSFNCEVSDLSLRPSNHLSSAPTTGAAITFSQPINPSNIRIRDVMITTYGNIGTFIHHQGIAVTGTGFGPGGAAVWVVTIERVRIAVQSVGIYLPFAVNWTLTDIIVNMPADAAPGSNIFGVWLDTLSEGCEFNDIYVLGGEHCWRMTNSAGACGGVRGPCEHRFNYCIGDNGTVSCIYISSLHRAIFSYCWCSTQSINSDATVVMDSFDIWGVDWTASQIVNVNGHGIKVLAAVSFSVTNSTFSEWNLGTSPSHSAILVAGVAGTGRTNFQIIGNRFIQDVDFGGHANSLTVSVLAGNYNKYVITGNCSYAGFTCTNVPPGSLVGTGSLSPISDLGTAVSKFTGNNV